MDYQVRTEPERIYMPGHETDAWAAFIRDLLKREYGGNQSARGRSLGIKQSTVNRWMHGPALPDVPSLVRLSELHGIPLLELLAIAFGINLGQLVAGPGPVTAAIYADAKLSPELRQHFLNQYELLL